MENTWEIHKDEAWLLQDALQSEKQRRNHNFSYKKIIWRIHYIKTGKNRQAYNMHRLTNLIITINGFY
jgi:hypothetical protein